MITSIPLNKGLITQADPEDVGANACTELINVEFDKPGLIYKRKGTTVEVSTSKTFKSLMRWYNPNISGDYYWIGVDTSDDVWYTTDASPGSSWTELFLAGDFLGPETPGISSAYDIIPIDYSSMLRFSCGRDDSPRLLQYIDRDFFWSAEEGTPGFYTDIGRPRDVLEPHLSSIEIFSSTDTYSWFHNGSIFIGASGIDLSANTYHYKLSYVFDGIQETPLVDAHIDTGSITGTKIPWLEISYDTGSSLANWNKRITGINIYRASSYAGAYLKVCSVSTKSNDPNAKDLTGCKPDTSGDLGKYAYLRTSSGELTDNLDGKMLLYNGHRETFASSSSSVGNGVHKLAGALGLEAYHGGAGRDATEDDSIWAEDYIIIDSNLITASSYGKFESANSLQTDGWSVVGGTLANEDDTDTWYITDGTTSLTEDKVLYFSVTGGANSAYTLLTPNMTISAETEYIAECWIRPAFSGSTTVGNFELSIATDSSAPDYGDAEGKTVSTIVWSTKDTDTYKRCTTPGGDKLVGWERIVSKVTSGAGETNAKVCLRVLEAGSGNPEEWVIDQLTFGKVAVDARTTGKAYAGKYVACGSNWDLGLVDSHSGYTFQNGDSIGDDADKRGWIWKNSKRAVYLYNDLPRFPINESAPGSKLRLNDNYFWTKSGNTQKLTFFDKNTIGGVQHPTGETSLDVKYEYSKFINGRNYVAGVRISDGQVSEDHENWIMFSELNQPDVIPIVNYIQLNDAQGGKIVGIESLFGDIVAFMEHGIYRLSIPSTDPTQWSLSEAEENTGCLNRYSITAWESGLFFAGKEHIYFLDANFRAVPITESIWDTYKTEKSATNTRTFFDALNNRLLCRFGEDATTIYSLDLSLFPGEERWSKITSGLGDFDFFTVNENLELWSYDEATSKIAKHDDSKAESTLLKRTTGWISPSDLDKSVTIRRLNLKYKSGVAITAKFYIDGDDGTVIKTIEIPSDTSGADWYKCKPGIRCRSYKIELSTEATTSDVEIRRIEVEVE